MRTYEQLTVFPIDSLPVADQIHFLEQELEGYKKAFNTWSAWCNDDKNKMRNNFDCVANYVRQKALQITDAETKLKDLKEKC